MRLNIKTHSFFQNPFHKKSLICLVCLLLFSFSANTFAIDDVQKLDLETTRKLLKKAKKLRYKGRLSEAEKILRQIIARHPQNSVAKLDLAYILLKQKRLVDAYEYSFEVARDKPKNAYAFAVLGATYLNAGNFREARKLLRNAIILNKKTALAWAGLGMLDFYENRIDRGILNLREAVQRDSKEPDFAFTLAQVSARAERYREAADAYDKFLLISSRSDKERRDRIKGLIRFLRFLGKKSSLYNLGGKKSTSVNMDLLNNRPVVQVRLRKKGRPLKFVLDTGSGISVISNKTAKKLGIKPITKGGLARALGGTGKFQIVYGFLNKVYIGDVNIRNVPVYIRQFHNRKERVDGYIGLSLISKYITTIDYGDGSFTLVRKREFERRQNKLGIQNVAEKGSMTMPLRLTSSGFLSGEVKLDGFDAPFNFIVDTGASVSVISNDLANSQELSSHILDETMRVVGAAGITENVPSFMLPELTFGNFSRKKLKAIALDLDLINETSGFVQAGILGGNFLKNYRMTFDFKKSKVTFVPHNKK